MTDNNHPITPPLELVQQWVQEIYGLEGMPGPAPGKLPLHIATQAARWGFKQCMKLDAAWLEAKLQKARDEELEACCEWLSKYGHTYEIGLRTARRPKPPSLKEQALGALGRFNSNAHTQASQMTQDFEIIRRALEQLPDQPLSESD